MHRLLEAEFWQLTIDVSNYILHHLSESITTDAITKELFMSRSHLSHTFKAETGIALIIRLS